MVRHLRSARGIAGIRAGASGALSRLSPPPAHAPWTTPRANDLASRHHDDGWGARTYRGFSAGPSETKGDAPAAEGDDVKVDASHVAEEPDAKPEPEPDAQPDPKRDDNNITVVMRPSMWLIPTLMYRALRARLDMWWVRVMVDPTFDEREFLTGAVSAHEVVLKSFAANDMRSLGPMLTDRALAAFRDAFIEADRGNVTMDVVIERNENPIIVEMAIRVNDDVPDDKAEEVMGKVRASISNGAAYANRNDEARFDSGEDELLRLRVGVRFNSREMWTMTDKVSGSKTHSLDLRGHTFVFGRALPRFLPATDSLTSPWKLEDVK